ncbi:M20/M25/M40 family metallo-hydrolase [Heliorestis acidaminivorans]|uniref:M20/M25/M40 family metallo-hydrolase n=1 Tax=Heliorestis acidaminivorans TaxID=553427 RepID=A0A6I0F6D2_9FIRM|nr:M20/M25/M40 family metallo-hydrolase [Heliorestis acidaminivorans]KAB2954532.1 M20/M25/M40 family metallo-hydrolase [Heliorestis acidaminivorans]
MTGKGNNPWGERPPRAPIDDEETYEQKVRPAEKAPSSQVSRRRFLVTGVATAALSLTALGWHFGRDFFYGPTSEVLMPLEAMAQDRQGPCDLAVMMDHIATLSQPAFEGRLAGTAGEARAGEYIARLWERWDLEPRGDAATYFQTFAIPPLTLIEDGERARLQPTAGPSNVADNLIGFLPGRDPFLRQQVVVLSAHYDHLGQWGNRFYGGANDNGSGVALLLELARQMTQRRPRRSVAFIAFSGEEAGLLGSRHYVNHASIPLEHMVALINLDTLANGNAEDFIYWSANALPWQDKIHAIAEDCGIRINHQSTDRNSSDHRPFEEKGVPAMTILSNQWLHKNHTVDDDISLINPEKLQKIANWTWQMTYALADDGDNVGG